MQKLVKHPEWQELICDYIRQFGRIEGCTSVLPQTLSIETVKNALDYKNKKGLFLIDFATKVQQALCDFKDLHRHPSQDPELKQDFYALFAKIIRNGTTNECKLEYDENGQVIKRSWKRSFMEKWVFDVMYPKPEFSQESILIVIPNLIEMVSKRNDLSPEFKEQYLKVTFETKDKMIEQLQKMGMPTRYLNDS